jgi:glucan 1,3-beta-glucosidase
MGEWSGAMTDCAKWLNGRNKGARWDGSLDGGPVLGTCSNMTGDSAGFSDNYKTFLRKYWEVQSVLGDSVQGNIWWTWKVGGLVSEIH